VAVSVQKIIDKKDQTIIDSENELLSKFDSIEKDIYNAVLKKVKTFNQKDGKIVFDDDNVTSINEINQIVAESIQKSDYVNQVKQYLRDFDTIKEFNFDIQKDVNDLSRGELEDLINPVQRGIVNQTLTNLTGQGVNTNFIDPLREGIYKNVVAGTTITDLEGYLNAFINTNPERMGQFKRYVSQVSRDALNQFDGQVNSRIADEFGLDAFRYVGSIIEDSRPQCVRWVGKGVILKEDLSNELNWAYSNGTGMIPGTTTDNFAVYRGGYNCRHSAIPFKLTKSQRKELGMDDPISNNPIPQEQPKLTPQQKNIEGLSQAQKDLNLTFGQSPLVPKQLKGMNIPDQLYILSDNGKTSLTQSTTEYDTRQQKVKLAFKGNRAEGSKVFVDQSIYHEFGHRTHFEKKWFVFNSKDNNPRHQKYFDESVEIFKQKFPADKLTSEIRQNFTIDKLFTKYKDKFEGLTEKDLREYCGGYTDTIEAITIGNLGQGHGKKYFLQAGGSLRQMEWFAHASENYWMGNPVFQAEFPELFDKMIEYYKKEVIEMELKDYLKYRQPQTD